MATAFGEPVTEALVDAKDDARQAEVRTDIASALLTFEQRFGQAEQRMAQLAYWIIAFVIGTAIGATGVVIAVLR